MIEIAALGEAMIRLSPKNHDILESTNELEIKIGGTEANFCVALKRLGINTGWISKLTDNPLGKKIYNELMRWGVDVSQIIWTKDYRIGSYYLEKGSYPRPSNVIYDRQNSAICYIKKEEINWNYLNQAKLFHTTGITLALSDNCYDTASECLKIMKKNGKITSFDINYRSKLWTSDTARIKISNILKHIDIIFTSESDLFLLFGEADLKDKCNELINKYSNKIIVVTRGEGGPYALDNKGVDYNSQGIKPELVDRIGAGDAFDAGFIYGYLSNGIQHGLDYGIAMAALKFSIPGDLAIISKEEVEALVKKTGVKIKR